jgi:nitrate reductase NapD
MDEYHVASLIVRCHPHKLEQVWQRISDIDGAEVHASDPSGKLIVTAEGPSAKSIASITEHIWQVTDVVDAANVYHEYAPDVPQESHST